MTPESESTLPDEPESSSVEAPGKPVAPPTRKSSTPTSKLTPNFRDVTHLGGAVQIFGDRRPPPPKAKP
jgi:hypothetical protein